MVQPLLGRGRRWIAVALAQASLAEFLQVLFRTFLLGCLKRGKLPLAQAKAAVVLLDSLGNTRRDRQRLIHAGKEAVHFLGTAHVKLVGQLAVVGDEPRFVQGLVERLARVNAEQDVVGQVVILGQVVGVAGGHHRESEPSGQVELARHAVALDLQAVVLDLDEEVPLAEGLVVPHGQVLGLGHAIVQQQLREFGANTSRQADQPLAVLCEDLLVDPGLVVIALEIRPRREPKQIAKAGAVARQQGQMIGIPLVSRPARAGRPIGSLAGRDVGFDSHDRDDSRRLGLAEEFDRAEEVAMIRERHGGHPQRFDAADQVGDLALTVEQAVMTVTVKMYKRL